jgi:hypothetical protein
MVHCYCKQRLMITAQKWKRSNRLIYRKGVNFKIRFC